MKKYSEYTELNVMIFFFPLAGIPRLSGVAASASGQQKGLSRLPLPQQQGKRSTSVGPRERSLNRNPLSAITPVGRHCKY